MENLKCPECGTVNEAEYVYCKNCGAALCENSQQQSRNGNSEAKNGNPHFEYAVDSINGIPREEVAAFIGQKAFKILPKLSKMEITRSRASWCWPAAILGFIFGPIGSALWFFYRKMYKPAFLLTAIGALLTFATTLMTLNTATVDIDSLFSSFSQGNINGIIDSVAVEETVLSTLASIIDDAATLGSGILCGLFGYYIYKKHCISKICKFRGLQTDSRYYTLGLAAVGGTSGGMLAVGIVIMLAVSYASGFISTLAAML